MITQKTFAKVKNQIDLPGVFILPGCEGWLCPYKDEDSDSVGLLFETDKIVIDITTIHNDIVIPLFFELEQIPQP